MKSFIALFILFSVSSANAAGSWKISCTSDSGISFYSDNGQAEILFSSVNEEGTMSSSTSEVEIENFDLGFDQKDIKVLWTGKQSIMEDRYENSCRVDYISTVFSQQVEIKDTKKNTNQIVNVVCREEIITGSGSEEQDCSLE